MTVWIGTSGWQYRDWRGPVYPPKLKQAAWLEHFVTLFDTVEVNNSFYRLPEATSFAQWGARTPEHFVVTVKSSRYLTHIKRLVDPEEPVDLFMDRAKHLGPKLGPVLVQLPPKFKVEVARLERTLAAFARHGARVAVEPRDDTWFVDEVRDVLARYDAPLVWSDRYGKLLAPLWRTATWGYVRLHEGDAEYPCYQGPTLDAWARRIANAYPNGEQVFVYFNNDPRGCAVHDGARFRHSCERIGLATTSAPDPQDHQPVSWEERYAPAAR